jgi:rubrerythrin
MNTKFLTDSEILTVAMNIEEEGYSFYNAAAGTSRHKESREIFKKLAAEEVEHKKTFSEILNSLPSADSRDYFGIADEIASYLRALVETGVFKGIDDARLKKMSEIEALETGVKAERDSILFYTEAQDSSANPKAKRLMSRIIDIEKGHLVTLTNRLRVARKLF